MVPCGISSVKYQQFKLLSKHVVDLARNNQQWLRRRVISDKPKQVAGKLQLTPQPTTNPATFRVWEVRRTRKEGCCEAKRRRATPEVNPL